MAKFEPGVYRHYKGNDYEATHLGIDEATEEPVVLYRPMYDCPDLEAEYGLRPYFVRKLDVFSETVETDQGAVPRFTRVGDL